MSKQSNFSIRVYYADTDAGGVVYHSNYLDFCEKARTEFLRERNVVQSIMLESSGGFVVKSAEMDFKKPAKLDDLLNVKTQIVENNGLVLKMLQEIYCTDHILFFMKISLVFLNREHKLVRIPKEVMEILK
ncbi:MAG: YbgC/FadM family acyl-CoA thioesterase [Rickettsiales bacterium]|jgi:acyl-CoA thioester hydrolase|nr:YbgC/FadM family acyl-CoA thioesterase [Rickettsiales bacterium]